jgi:hypothetical protein
MELLKEISYLESVEHILKRALLMNVKVNKLNILIENSLN